MTGKKREVVETEGALESPSYKEASGSGESSGREGGECCSSEVPHEVRNEEKRHQKKITTLALASPHSDRRLSVPRSIRSSRSTKRQFHGEESDEEDSTRRHVRIRSMVKLCGQGLEDNSGSTTTSKGLKLAKQEETQVFERRKTRRPSKFVFEQTGNERKDPHSSRGSRGRLQQPKVQIQPRDPMQIKGRKKVIKDEPVDTDPFCSLPRKKPYTCHYEGCNKGFTERSKLKRHFLTHTGEKSFVCLYEGCGKAFSLDFNLRSHMKTHTGEYHECPHEGCDKRYCQEYKLRAHISRDHKEGRDGCGRTIMANGVVGGAVKVKVGAGGDAATREEKRNQLELWRHRLEKWREGRRKRIREIEAEKLSELTELGKIDKALRRLENERQKMKLEEEAEEEDDEAEKLDEEGEEEEEEEEEAQSRHHHHPPLFDPVEIGIRKESGFFSYDEGGPLLFAGGRFHHADHGATLVTLPDRKAILGNDQACSSPSKPPPNPLPSIYDQPIKEEMVEEMRPLNQSYSQSGEEEVSYALLDDGSPPKYQKGHLHGDNGPHSFVLVQGTSCAADC